MAADPKDSPRHYYTLEEYFALERTGDARYEFWDGEIVCMSGGSKQHLRISGNVYFGLRRQLTGGVCEVFTSDLAIKTPLLPPYRYADVSVVCGETVFENVEGIDVATNPTLIVEVLSPTTDTRDRQDKRKAYQAIPSLMEYLLLAQAVPHLTHFLRQGNDWLRSDYGDLASSIVLPSIGCVLTLSDAYLGIKFE